MERVIWYGALKITLLKHTERLNTSPSLNIGVIVIDIAIIIGKTKLADVTLNGMIYNWVKWYMSSALNKPLTNHNS